MKKNYTLTALALLSFLNSCTGVSNAVGGGLNLSDNIGAKDKITRNYNKLVHNTSGAVFSYGDTERLQKGLHYMASIPRGQEILAALKETPEITSDSMRANKATYQYSETGTNLVSLNSNYIKNLTPAEIAFSLIHEVTHHLQYELKITPAGNFLSFDQAVLCDKLNEAETFAWTEVLRATQTFFTEHPAASYQNLKPLMTADLVSEARKKEPKNFNEAKFKKTDPLYLFQQALIQNGGNRAKADKIAVGKIISMCMAKQAASQKVLIWRASYDLLSILFGRDEANRSMLTTQGNQAAMERILNHYASMYYINKADISTLHLKKEAQTLREQVIAKINERGSLLKGDAKMAKKMGKKQTDFMLALNINAEL